MKLIKENKWPLFKEKLFENRYILNRKKYLRNEKLYENTMDFSAIPKIMNDLITNSLITDWVIGGGSALSYYTDPIATIDIDVFIVLESKSPFILLEPIYTFLKNKYDAKAEKEMIKVKGLYFQFLVAGDNLTQEAVNHYEGIGRGIKLFKLEYLIGIMLQLGGSKYRSRLFQVKSEQKFDEALLNDILKRHNLVRAWENIKV